MLTDNPRTVTVDHVAGVLVRHPQVVEVGRHYGTQVHTCVPYDPGSKGGTEETVKIATADLVPTEANLRPQYACFAELEATCEALTVKVNARKHRESARVPDEALTAERVRLHVLPAAPHTAALGMTRIVNTDQTIRFGSVRYSTPPGLVGSEVWVGVAGTVPVIVADLDALSVRQGWADGRAGGVSSFLCKDPVGYPLCRVVRAGVGWGIARRTRSGLGAIPGCRYRAHHRGWSRCSGCPSRPA